MEKDINSIKNIVLDNYKKSRYYELSEKSESEQELEDRLIDNLVKQGYEYSKEIKDSESMIINLRKQIESLNNIEFSEEEWNQFYDTCIDLKEDTSITKTKRLHEENYFSFPIKEKMVNIYLWKKELEKNKLQVIRQYRNVRNVDRHAIYDVTILVNGLPLVHIELKRRSVSLEEAFNQIGRYSSTNFKNDYHSLFNYVQLFVISNGTITKYFANTTKEIESSVSRKKTDRLNTNYSFATSWADSNNQVIEDLEDFSLTFLTKNTLLSVLFKYCVFNTQNQLLVMRPYQIAAVERIYNKVCLDDKSGHNLKRNGYIWHTTGSGKTLTSFKAAKLLKENNNINKVIFVVDRKDLDAQTIQEYSKFDKEFTKSVDNTKHLAFKITSNTEDDKVVVTTIQKLDRFVKSNNSKYDRKTVLIFDECHRSQFGEMHDRIKNYFTNSFMFGFTETPIFEQNKHNPNRDKTLSNYKKQNTSQSFLTEDLFGELLHKYTILEAIKDKKVLGFNYQQIIPVKVKENIEDKEVIDINVKEVLESERWVHEVSENILKNFHSKTLRNSAFKDRNVNKLTHNVYNSLFTVSSIPMAIKYFNKLNELVELRKQTDEAEKWKEFKIACIFSYNPNSNIADELLDTEEDLEVNDSITSAERDSLDKIIEKYNKDFGTSHSSNGDKFDQYYKDIATKVKENKIHILIVVNMFLTGFDAPCLNTLWIDRQLKYHGLIQAFSRTNRVQNQGKQFGNIVSFQNNKDNLDNALELFGDKTATQVVLALDYEEVYKQYEEISKELLKIKDIETNCLDEQKKDFVQKYNKFLKIVNLLLTDSRFEAPGAKIIEDRDLDNLTSKYNEFWNQIRKQKEAEKESILDSVIFESTLLEAITVNASYILQLVRKAHANKDELLKEGKIEITKNDILNQIEASNLSYSKKELLRRWVKANFSFEEILNIDEFMNLDKGKYIEDKITIFTQHCINEDEKNRVTQYIEKAIRKMLIPAESDIRTNLRIEDLPSKERKKIANDFISVINEYTELYGDNWYEQ